MTDQRNLEHLLQNTKKIVQHHKEIIEAKGDHFNIFSVLGIESRENKTHSAFLSELLNPKGNHHQKDVFLKLFLQVVNKEISRKEGEPDLIERFINSAKTEVVTEFTIGKRNDVDKEGGRVDIFLKNRNNIICIENEIYASDQYAQIERYCNYKEEYNTVFYLTLKGEDPHQNSRGELESGEHFFNISYSDHIVEWLELCLKEVPNLTSVREAINQYILIIKKLTNTLNMKQEKELQNLMANYLEESKYVATKYEKMVASFQEKFRKDIEDQLQKELSGYEVHRDEQVESKYSKLWIFRKEWKEQGFKFGLEPFSGKGHGNGYLFVGLFDKNNLEIIKDIPEEGRLNNWWKHTRPILTEAGNEIKMQDLYTLNILANPERSNYLALLNRVIKKTVEFINEYEKELPAEIIKNPEEIAKPASS